MSYANAVLRLLGALVVVAVLAACSLALVPEYDQSLVDKIDQANTKAETMFAAIANGSPRSAYAKYAPTYDELIGTFTAIQTSVAARPVPPLAARFLGAGQLKSLCQNEADPTACVNSSGEKLGDIVTDLTELKREHGKLGLFPDTVRVWQQNYEFSVLQVLTIENALKR